MHFLNSVYYELTYSTCFQHYLLIFRRCCTNINWYIPCILCRLAATRIGVPLQTLWIVCVVLARKVVCSMSQIWNFNIIVHTCFYRAYHKYNVSGGIILNKAWLWTLTHNKRCTERIRVRVRNRKLWICYCSYNDSGPFGKGYIK
jgi:hypothetical protein